jgi:cyclopropane-fatty-acyl-phospholipid synthase
MNLLPLVINAIERGLVPDWLTRLAIRRLCRSRLDRASSDNSVDKAFQESLRSGSIALVPEVANQQHYELPPEFFQLILGLRRKYSCCFFPDATSTLAEAEEAALAETCRRAQIENGQEILELGCGWGSLTLWMAEQYPQSRITAVSNSMAQKRSIDTSARERGLTNLTVITADMNEFVAESQAYDRVVSVEMFEHMRNLDELFRRIAGWLTPEGKLFLHVFCHKSNTYPFETEGDANWMGQYFFTGGMMPSAHLYREFSEIVSVERQQYWNGTHYQCTAEAWLANLDANRDSVQRILNSVYGPVEGRRWFHRWRMFFLAVAELFGYANGEEWFVTHYLMQPAVTTRQRSKLAVVAS